MVKIYRKLHRSMDTLSFFTCNSWTWANNNLELLRHQLTPDDLKVRLVKRRAFRMQVVEPTAARCLKVLLSVTCGERSFQNCDKLSVFSLGYL